MYPIVSCTDSPYGLDDRKPCTGTVFLTMAYVCFGDQTLNVVSKTPKIEFRNSHVLPSLPNPVFCDALLANPKAVLGRVPQGQASPAPPCRQPLHPCALAPHTSVQYSHLEPNNESFVASRNGMKQPFSRSNPFRKQVETIHGHCLDPVAGVD